MSSNDLTLRAWLSGTGSLFGRKLIIGRFFVTLPFGAETQDFLLSQFVFVPNDAFCFAHSGLINGPDSLGGGGGGCSCGSMYHPCEGWCRGGGGRLYACGGRGAVPSGV